MYIKDFITTYKSIEDYEISFPLYQSQLLQAFNISKFNESEISNQMDIIEKELINDDSFIQIKLNLLKNFDNSLFNENNISMLFLSYDYFDEFQSMCKNINFVKLTKPDQIYNSYAEATDQGGVHLILEYPDLYETTDE